MNKFDEDDIIIASFGKAIGHPARVAILRQLAAEGDCICGEIVDVLPLAQSTVSQHLLELKKAGLITGTADGVKSRYAVNWEVFENMTEEFLVLFKDILLSKNVEEE